MQQVLQNAAHVGQHSVASGDDVRHCKCEPDAASSAWVLSTHVPAPAECATPLRHWPRRGASSRYAQPVLPGRAHVAQRLAEYPSPPDRIRDACTTFELGACCILLQRNLRTIDASSITALCMYQASLACLPRAFGCAFGRHASFSQAPDLCVTSDSQSPPAQAVPPPVPR